MEKDIRERIALKRYQLISPVLAEPARAQNEYFRKQADREHDFPRYGLKKISVSTFKAWLRDYRKGGFEALKPKGRSDSGRPKRLDEQAKEIERKKAVWYKGLEAGKFDMDLVADRLNELKAEEGQISARTLEAEERLGQIPKAEQYDLKKKEYEQLRLSLNELVDEAAPQQQHANTGRSIKKCPHEPG